MFLLSLSGRYQTILQNLKEVGFYFGYFFFKEKRIPPHWNKWIQFGFTDHGALQLKSNSCYNSTCLIEDDFFLCVTFGHDKLFGHYLCLSRIQHTKDIFVNCLVVVVDLVKISHFTHFSVMISFFFIFLLSCPSMYVA